MIVCFLALMFSSQFTKITALNEYPILLISFDGLRSDKLEEYLAENPSSNFQRIINSGVKADYMIPSFPSATFPNHWTIVTGLYPESHGRA